MQCASLEDELLASSKKAITRYVETNNRKLRDLGGGQNSCFRLGRPTGSSPPETVDVGDGYRASLGWRGREKGDSSPALIPAWWC